jgi:membrane protease YdiL (CAAX protease family)
MNPLYNPADGRLRAFWRLLIQFALFFLGSSVFGLFLVILATIVLTLTGQIPAAIFGNPSALTAILSAKIVTLPFLQLVNAIFNLALILATYWGAARFLDRRPLPDYGFHFGAAWWRDLGFGLGAGALLMVLVFLGELAAGWVRLSGFFQSLEPGQPFFTGILQTAGLYVCVGIYEEMLSRGYQLRNLAEGLNLSEVGSRSALWMGYVLSSLLFGALHLANPHASVVSTLNLVLAGMLFGLGFVLTGELAIPIGMHIAWNFVQGGVFGYPVSGGSPSVAIVAIHQRGPELWTGGAFGPEAGLAGLLAILLGAILVLWWVRRTRGSLRLQLRLAEYQGKKPTGNPQTGPFLPLQVQDPPAPAD